MAPGSAVGQNALPEPSCVIDTLSGTLSTGGYVAVGGWAADPNRATPVAKVEITLDGTVLGETTLGGLRPDVRAHFSRRIFCGRAGTACCLWIGFLPAGTR
jgi:hypothetical protein